MSLPKLSITYWVGRLPDGNPFACECRVTPIGFYNTVPDSFWTHLEPNLTVVTSITRKGEVRDFLRQVHPEELGNLLRS